VKGLVNVWKVSFLVLNIKKAQTNGLKIIKNVIVDEYFTKCKTKKY
jgi:hypothetical protein